MKKLIAIFSIVASTFVGMAQTSTNDAPPTFINGDINIIYNSRKNLDSTGAPLRGFNDVYNINVNVCNSAIFRGTITQQPFIVGSTFTAAQPGTLTYAMNCDVVNPKNPTQTRNAGRIFGVVPVDKDGIYRYESGNLETSIEQMGSSPAFRSKFAGLVVGKPPVKVLGMVESLQKQALTLRKTIQGKTEIIVVKNYDKMEFKSHVIAAGPVQIYPDITLNGNMIYDGDRSVWYFDNLVIIYNNGRQSPDRLTGNIRWVEAPDRKSSGAGEYQFDIRVNEPPPNEAAMFAGAADESAFFTTDATIPGLTGTMKYKDTMSGDKIVASSVKLDLHGNKLTKQQVMSLCKLLVFSSVVPLNAE
jgi:hypothetical protein